ncbi:MAG: hypothetical protein EXR52_02010 [Dehalococcoidia bacterium]|nr:hypothetical protein [Dehalococcoidia bacterium]
MRTSSEILRPLAVTAIGSMPHPSVTGALPSILACQHIPAWPQLVQGAPSNGMLAQALAGVPGLAVGPQGQVTLPAGFSEKLVAKATPKLPDGLACLKSAASPDVALKGQIAGPVTLSLNCRLTDGGSAADDPDACDAVAGFVACSAAVQEAALGDGVLFLDEPDLARGLRDARLGPGRCRSLLGEVLSAVKGPVGIHTCDVPDLRFLSSLPVDVISLDAYRYGADLPAPAVADFLRRGGWLAWGIVPSEAGLLQHQNATLLSSKLRSIWRVLEREGVPPALLWSRALITPSCGLGRLAISQAEFVLSLTQQVAASLRGEQASHVSAGRHA